MPANDWAKWLYAFFLTGAWLGWSAFTVIVVLEGLKEPSAVGIIEAAGAGGVTGGLGALVVIVVQHFFHRAKPDEGK